MSERKKKKGFSGFKYVCVYMYIYIREGFEGFLGKKKMKKPTSERSLVCFTSANVVSITAETPLQNVNLVTKYSI